MNFGMKKQVGEFFGGVKIAARREFAPVANVWKMRRSIKEISGQGTTEYAILVGVLVVIAILAITVFRPKIQELWDAISSGINGL